MTCGFERLCNISNFNLPYRLNFSYLQNNAKICPNCGCDSECMTRQDCCPDFYFSQTELLCLNVTLLNNFPPNSQHGNIQERYPLVSTCPNGTDTKLKEQCTGSKDIIQSLKTGGPVSNDEGLRLSYRNKYCAECNGVQHFTNWMLDIDCVDFADFNYYQHFQKQETVVECNVTGLWEPSDPVLESACRYYRHTHTTFPYKNIFCYFCNRNNAVVEAEEIWDHSLITYIDTKTEIEEN
ncbi:hypothetical protein KUTeg_009316 [Tegillarca granosa]|uniref:SMB domain-containing protein n=1 Tax=Tegillarca granosa TaxID=220873 RepID=A0ABQ9F6X2_TEGGR|nr:hypothetical protein KUTeg_009316 [Tegillarca granosa]